MSRVLEDIRADSVAAREKDELKNGVSAATKGGGGNNVVANGGRGERGQSLALPKNVVEEGVRITRECLELVCEVGE